MILATTSLGDISSIITNVGFPIFCVIALGLFVYKAFDKITAMNAEREQKLYTMLGETREQLSEATKINAGFIEVLNSMRKDVDSIGKDVDDIKTKINKEA